MCGLPRVADAGGTPDVSVATGGPLLAVVPLLCLLLWGCLFVAWVLCMLVCVFGRALLCWLFRGARNVWHCGATRLSGACAGVLSPWAVLGHCIGLAGTVHGMAVRCWRMWRECMFVLVWVVVHGLQCVYRAVLCGQRMRVCWPVVFSLYGCTGCVVGTSMSSSGAVDGTVLEGPVLWGTGWWARVVVCVGTVASCVWLAGAWRWVWDDIRAMGMDVGQQRRGGRRAVRGSARDHVRRCRRLITGLLWFCVLGVGVHVLLYWMPAVPPDGGAVFQRVAAEGVALGLQGAGAGDAVLRPGCDDPGERGCVTPSAVWGG